MKALIINRNHKKQIAIVQILKIIFLFCLLICFSLIKDIKGQHAVCEYPVTYKSNTVDNFFGIEVKDPYRWLEDLNSEQTLNWVKQQEKILSKYQKRLILQERIHAKLLEFSFAKFKPLIKKGKYYFYFKYGINNLRNPPSLYYQEKINDDNGKRLINPAKFKIKKDDIVTIRDYDVSKDNRFLAFSLSYSGKDWRKIMIIDLTTGKTLEDIVDWVKFSEIAWKDNGFFYVKFDSVFENEEITAINKNPKLYYHKVGTAQKKDRIIYEPPDENETIPFDYKVTSDEKYLVLKSYILGENKDLFRSILYLSLDSATAVKPEPFIIVDKMNTNEFDIIDNICNKFLVITDQTAPTSKVLLYDSKFVNQAAEIIPPYKNVLIHADLADKKIICLYYLEGEYTAIIYDLNGNLLKSITFPEGCKVRAFDCKAEDKEAFFFLNSFYSPPVVYRLDLIQLSIESLSTTFIAYDHTDYYTYYVKYKSNDGTEIPMYITHKKDLKMDGENPTLLYGYGGFGVSLTPFFRPETVLWIENGGIFAVPNLRGGGELGSEWHKSGQRLNKSNVFEDFISAAQYLIDNNYTNSAKLAIEGGSNGGLLVGVAMTKRPDLFEAAIPKMAVCDMLRYQNFTIGYSWIQEYGLSSDSIDFFNLYSYSPLHNIKNNIEYPATLAITADNDDRVPPLHTYKFIATLQEKGGNNRPYLLKIEHHAGHYGAEALDARIQTTSLKLAFLFESLNVAFKLW